MLAEVDHIAHQRPREGQPVVDVAQTLYHPCAIGQQVLGGELVDIPAGVQDDLADHGEGVES